MSDRLFEALIMVVMGFVLIGSLLVIADALRPDIGTAICYDKGAPNVHCTD
jgi:hypothetical protein